jgi:hypothetical protein
MPSVAHHTGTLYYAPEVAELLHSAQTKYYWGLGFKIAAAPLLLLSLYGLVQTASAGSQPGGSQLLGNSLAADLVLLAGAAVCIIAALVFDKFAGDDVAEAAAR